MSNSVMIIDGDPTFAENAQQALEEAGMTVHVRFDVSLDDVRTLRPRVLMLSAELPRGSGFGICSRIRRDRTLRDTAIFMTSSETTPQAIARHAQSAEPANDYARKDIPMSDLVDRVSRLLAQAPTLLVQDPHSGASGPVTDRLQAFPPPLPLRGDSVNGETLGPVGPTSGTSQVLELFPVEALEAEYRQALVLNEIEPLSASRSSPEERLLHLRKLVKLHEGREKAFRNLWDDVVRRGQDLARRLVRATTDLGDAAMSIVEARRQAEAESQQRIAIQTEFQTFEEEIRRIFSDKDEEEQVVRSELAKLRVSHASLVTSAESAKELRQTDQRRIELLQEELEGLHADRDAAHKRATTLSARLTGTEQQLETTTAALKKEQDDALTAASNAHRAEVASIRERYDQLIGELEDQLRSTIDAEQSTRRDELDRMSQRYETQLREMATAHAAATARLTEELEDAHTKTTAAVDERARAEAQHREVEAEFMRVENEIAEARAAHQFEVQLGVELRAEVDLHRTSAEALHAELEARYRELTDAHNEAERNHAELVEARRQTEAAETALAETAERAHQLETNSGELAGRLRDAETLLEAARRRFVESDRAVKERDAQLSEAQGLIEAQREELDEAEQIHDDLEGQVTKLAQQRIELEQVLSERQDQVRSLRQRESELIETLARTEGKLASAEIHRQELSRALSARDDTITALQTKAAESSERSRTAEALWVQAETDQQTSVAREQSLKRRLSAQENEINELRFLNESIRSAMQALLRDLDGQRRTAAAPEVKALLDRVERVTSMTLDSIIDEDGGMSEAGTPIDPLARTPDAVEEALAAFQASEDEDSLTQLGSAEALFKGLPLELDAAIDGDEDSNVTQVIDIGAQD